ncbi:hypothetical protein PDIDSM_3375 [Penicillium digitatum]|nr:hypothetical protein PDIDSM_3375 [Penicillium digitatum]
MEYPELPIEEVPRTPSPPPEPPDSDTESFTADTTNSAASAMPLLTGRNKELRDYLGITRNQVRWAIARGTPTPLDDIITFITTNEINRRLSYEKLINIPSLNISVDTLRRTLASRGYNRRVALGRPDIKEKNLLERLTWARAHVNWTRDDWCRIIWTDETWVTPGYHRKVDPTSSPSNHVADNPRQPENRTVEPTFHSLPAVASQSHTSLDEHIGTEEDVMQASYNIEDFTINSHEIDISSAVPKLKGQSNFRDWETALYIALAANNRYYTYMISNGIPIPKIPSIRTPVLKLFAIFLLKKLRILQKLRATYAVTSHQHSFARYTKWTDLRFKNGTASEFVRKFQETLRDLTSIDGKINSSTPNFLEVDIHNRSMNSSYNANSTTVQTSSSSHNDKKKDTKKGGNDKQSNSNNSSNNNNNKDKPSKKKTDFVKEENVILCRHHGLLEIITPTSVPC